MKLCNICGERYSSLEGLTEHIDGSHRDELPKDFTTSQYLYYLKTKKEHGNCVQCKRPTAWNESTFKYHRFCDDKKCKEKYREIFKARMIGAYGKEHLLDDPGQQKKMLANRSISGEYKWSDGSTSIPYTGSYELEFLKFLDVFMDFDSSDIMSPSPHTYYYVHEGVKRFYIPDFFIPSLNLEIEIKDGGNNPNTHHKIQAVDKVKEKLKDKVLTTQTKYSYIKITNRNYDIFFEFLNRAKENFFSGDNKLIDSPIFIVKESSNDSIDNAEPVTEATSNDKIHPVYVLLTYTNTNMAKAIRFFTGDPYSHASISFDSTMQDVYSFGRKYKDDEMKFANEDINAGVLNDVKDRAEYALYVTFVDNKQFEKMQKKLVQFKKRAHKLKFSFIGLFNIAIGKETSRENEYFCSQFVAELLKAGDKSILNRDPSLYTPYDLAGIERMHFVMKGKLKNYSKQTIDAKVKKIQDKLSSVTEATVNYQKELTDFALKKLNPKVDRNVAISKFRSVPLLPNKYAVGVQDLYIPVTIQEASEKKFNFYDREIPLNIAFLSISGMEKYIKDSGMSTTVRYFKKIESTDVLAITSIEYNDEYDYIAISVPINLSVSNLSKL